jgi:uncharacterized protein YdiU (UPF0061 family)
MLARLGVISQGDEADVALVNAAFRALQIGGDRLRWEPFFFDWFCGEEGRALAGVRGDLYAHEGFAEFRALLAGFAPARPGRLAHPMFAAAEPEELLIEEVEAIWAPIAAADDWSLFDAKLARLEQARQGWGLG